MRPSYLKRILLSLGCLLLTTSTSATEGKDIACPSGDQTVHGLLFTPSGKGPFPALLAIHAAFGLDDWTRQQASKLADSGYVVLALDLYRGKVANTLDEAVQISRPIPANSQAARVSPELQSANGGGPPAA
jgi:carboxymethylenebutenolidase